MGSGTEIKEALKNFGRKSFVKKILYEYDTKEEMLSKEKELVTREFCMREDTYNRVEGGGSYTSVGMVVVKDKEGNTSIVYKNDPRFVSGEFVGNTKDTVTVLDKEGKCIRVHKTDQRYLSGELIHNLNNNRHHWTGSKHSKSSKNKMSKKALLIRGEKKYAFGTCWINKEGKNKMIKKDLLEIFLMDNWVIGQIKNKIIKQ